MDENGETHYISFLGGDGGGVAAGQPAASRRTRTPAATTARDYLWAKNLGRLRTKLGLLIAAVGLGVVSLIGISMLLTESGSEPHIPETGGGGGMLVGGGGMDGGAYPTSIYDWQDLHFQAAFGDFMRRYAKSYKSKEERARRFGIFRANLIAIYSHNGQGHSYELGMNKFGDLTPEEFRKLYFGYKKTAGAFAGEISLGVDYSLSDATPAPSSVDWRSKGCVTPPKDQGLCGSCWAFSTTGSVEGAWCIATGKLTSLSEQYLVDCGRTQINRGCDGGLMDEAFEWIQRTGGICSESDYPYRAREQVCRKGCQPQAKLKGYYDVPPRSETAMKSALARKGPVSVGIQADQLPFQFYKSGVFDAPCGNDLDHGVLLVGYGTDGTSGKDYFIMKNSWGPDWGDHGFMLMAQHKGPSGQCGVLLSGSYPVADTSNDPGSAPS